MHVLSQIALVALGSSLGGLLRWGVGAACGRLLGAAFPWGTFLINVSGSLFLGWFLTVLRDRVAAGESLWLRAEDLNLLVAVGFTGAFTTFSTFEYEANHLLGDGAYFKSVAYMLGSLFLGLVAVRLGMMLARC